MQVKKEEIFDGKSILANDHFVAVPYDCTKVETEAEIIPAGTILPANDATAEGVLLHDVVVGKNPNGTLVVHGFIKNAALPQSVATTAKAALKQITFM